jgi:hypothetical protein
MQTFVVPNVPGQLGRCDTTRYAGDYSFIEETIKLMGEPVFVDHVIARIRPDRRPRLVIALDRALKLTPRARSARAVLKGALRNIRDREPGAS